MKKAELGPPCTFPLPWLPRGLGSGLCGRPGAPVKDSLREGEGQATVLVQERRAGAGRSIFSPPQRLPPHPRQGAQSSMASGSPEAVWGPQGSEQSEQGPSPQGRVEEASDGQSQDFPDGTG